MNISDNQFATAQPLIIIGMHRSGTSLITQVLKNCGVFVGADLAGGHTESQFFMKLNKEILSLAHANWDVPHPVEWLLQDPEVFDALVLKLKDELCSYTFEQYWGIDTVGANSFDTRLQTGWGWKDPRNTLTIKLWLALFPRARVLNIVRNGIDVANSLYVREGGRKCNFRSIARSARCQSVQRCFDLWAQYVATADSFISELPVDSTKTVYYETFLENPRQNINEVLHFAKAHYENTEQATETVNISNRYKFLHDKALCDLYEQLRGHQTMMKHGYQNIDWSHARAS